MSNTQDSKALIDDQSSNVTYHGNWIVGGAPEKEYNETVASTRRAGDSFEVAFNGWLIAVYGTLDYSSSGVRTNYSIDGREPTTVVSRAGAGDTYKQLFWTSDSGFDTLADHVLTVTMDYVNATYEEGEGSIWFDYFEIYGNAGDSVNSAELPSSTTPTTNPSTSSSGISPPPASNNMNVGVIVGAVVGGTVVLTVIAAAFLLHARERRQTQFTNSGILEDKFHTDYPYLSRRIIIQPFVVTSGSGTPGVRRKRASSGVQAVASTPQGPACSDQSVPAEPSIAQPTSHTRTESVVEHPAREQLALPVVLHTDSGLRGIEFPPVYTLE
ncbi:hypothetical protein HDZ31DRAFT_85838 [Schizophyllum fasciatum]